MANQKKIRVRMDKSGGQYSFRVYREGEDGVKSIKQSLISGDYTVKFSDGKKKCTFPFDRVIEM